MGGTGLAGVFTHPAGLAHPWGAITCRKAAPLTNSLAYLRDDVVQMSEAEIKAGGNPFDNVVVATRAPGTEQPEVNAGGGFFDGIKDAMSNFERNFTSGR